MDLSEKKILLTRFLNNQCTEEEVKQVVHLLSGDPPTEELEMLMEEAWDKIPLEYITEEKQGQEEELIEKLRRIQLGGRPVKTRQLWPLRMAAAIALLVLAGGGIFYGPQLVRQGQEALANTETVTSTGQIGKVKLSDGTSVRLNGGSVFQYPKRFYRQDRRGVYLQGEAYFEVAPDKEVPFVIRTQQANIRVVGTAFNVKEILHDSLVIVAVTEGKVWLQPVIEREGSAIALEAGQVAMVRADGSTQRIENEVDNYLSWFSRHLVFRNTSLPAVVQQLSHLYEVEIVLQDPELRELSFTGKMDRMALPVVIRQIALALDIQYYEKGGVYFMAKN